MVDGKILAEEEERLNYIATQLDLKLIEDYLGVSDELLADYDIDPDTVPDANQWFDISEGIQWFDSLISYIQENPDIVNDKDSLHAELQDFRKVLQEAKNSTTRWHLAMDI
ncbi:hypothetical protein AM1_0194 [Acaryochloris marina MBIC11017]|uniref:Uncharacterized protein n=2 Tax=Acaryochloris marina TaxID=155978 RepID=B0C7M0_ACAM1|nr:hypothetical protein AM1_0194 [Acaryochloris marina MBIC11017]